MQQLLQALGQQAGVLVQVARVQGSAPREVGAWMVVFADTVVGTVGGGQFEYQAIAQARALLATATPVQTPSPAPNPALLSAPAPNTDELRRYPLGPALGQCCGGVVWLRQTLLLPPDGFRHEAVLAILQQPQGQTRFNLGLFGGGHVGQALVQLAAELPCAVQWFDSREGVFPSALPPHIVCEHSDPVHAAVADVLPGSAVLVMSFSHAEDLDIIAACLKRQRQSKDLAWIGLIGSASKWARFRARLGERGYSEDELAQVVCPIGLPGIAGKQASVIALATMAQLLQRFAPPA